MRDKEKAQEEAVKKGKTPLVQGEPFSRQPQPNPQPGSGAHNRGGMASQNRKNVRHDKTQKKKQLYALGAAVGVLVVILGTVLLCKACSGKNGEALFNGTWWYSESAVYEFDGKGNGCMCINDSDHYDFTYQVQGKTLCIDYVLDYVTDCEYTFEISEERLILVGGEGTAEIGKTYELTKE